MPLYSVEGCHGDVRGFSGLRGGAGRVFGGTFLTECTPGYYNGEGRGRPGEGLIDAAGYPDGAVAFFALADAWRSSGDFDGLEMRPS